MKYLFTIFIFLLSIQFAIAQEKPDGPYKEFYDSGELKKEGQYKNNKRVGEWKQYHKNGQVSKEYSYNEGKYNKESISYFENGIVSQKTVLVDSVYVSFRYYESGSLKSKRQLKTGYYKGYFESGEIKTEAEYVDNDFVGEWKRYYKNGQLEWLVTYRDGYRHGLYKHYYKNGDIKLEGNNAKDKVDGEEKRFLPNNVLEWTGSYSKGLMNSKWTKYNINGEELEKVKIKNGVISKAKYNDILKPTKVVNGVTEFIPIYPGCEDGLTNNVRKACMNRNVAVFVNKNFNLDIAKDLPSGKKRILVQFKVNKKGEAEFVKALAPTPELKLEAYRVIKMLPKMRPAIQRDKPVIFPFSLPIVFQIK